MKKLNVKATALAAGLLWSLCTLSAGWMAMHGWCAKFVDVMSSIYIGYAPSFLGGVIGGLWGFADAALGGLLFALFYNWLSGCCDEK